MTPAILELGFSSSVRVSPGVPFSWLPPSIVFQNIFSHFADGYYRCFLADFGRHLGFGAPWTPSDPVPSSGGRPLLLQPRLSPPSDLVSRVGSGSGNGGSLSLTFKSVPDGETGSP